MSQLATFQMGFHAAETIHDLTQLHDAIASWLHHEATSAERRAGMTLQIRVRRAIGAHLKEPRLHGTKAALLRELGINNGQRMRWEALASLREIDFETSLQQRHTVKRNIHQASGSIVSDLGELISHGQTFGTIYADPPWPYGNQRTRGATHKYYTTMSLTDLAALPVSQLSAPKAHLHLWTTVSFLKEGLDLLEAWGFTYKSYLIWHKPQIGLGNYWRIGTEMLLLGIKGDCRFRQHDKPNHFSCKRGKHSRKPDQVRQWIEQVSPTPYLELFGRERIDHWTVFGNQIGITEVEFTNDHMPITQADLIPVMEEVAAL